MQKTQILAEIRRTARENGGQPLGWRRFLSETGIRQGDWLGVYWARWSDALRDAGFAPNDLTERYDSDALLEKVATLALSIGRVPTNGDMRLEAKKSPAGFPSDKTFARLGTRAQLLSLLRDYCARHEKFASVVALCDEYAPRPERANPRATPADQFELGFVYLIKSGRFYKIGKTNSIGRREYELGIQLPERAVTLHVIRTDDPAGIEAYWHNRFAAKRRNGEWFELAALDVAAFKRRKFM